MKTSRMKEPIMEWRFELEDICFNTHIEPDLNTIIDKSNEMIDYGKWYIILMDPSELLANIEA